MEMRAARNMAGVILMDKLRNSVLIERCGVEEDVTMIEKVMTCIQASVSGQIDKGLPMRIYSDQIEDVLKKS